MLTPAGDLDRFVDATAALLADHARAARLGDAARELSRGEHSWDAIGGRLVDAYREIVAGA